MTHSRQRHIIHSLDKYLLNTFYVRGVFYMLKIWQRREKQNNFTGHLIFITVMKEWLSIILVRVGYACEFSNFSVQWDHPEGMLKHKL